VDISRFDDLPNPIRARKSLNLQERFTIGYSGHLYTGRGVDLVFSLAEKLPKINFLIVGGNPEDVSKAKNRAKNNDLENINLTGFVPNVQLPMYQAASDILLMPYEYRIAGSSGGDSSRHCSPLKMFEYLASERAIIASDLPVLQEVISEDDTVILSPTDVDAWRLEIEKLKSDKGYRKRLAQNARQKARAHTWQRRAERILEGLQLS